MANNTNTPKPFVWKSQWLAKIKSLNDPNDRNMLLIAIVDYGLSGDSPYSLRGVGLDYFIQVVKPDIDKQHANRQRHDRQRQ